MSCEISSFGTLADGREIKKYTVINKNSAGFSVITYGAALCSLFAPDSSGASADILVGFDDLDGFVNRSDYQGVIVGPYANRIGGASFTLDGTRYVLPANENGVTCLHSAGAFNTAVWSAEHDGNSVTLSLVSEDMHNGFPGRLSVSVKYSLSDENELKLEYRAVSDKKTVINLTNHAYFNLGGDGDILNHIISINADYYTPVDAQSIPTGEIAPVEATPLDLRKPVAIGEHIDDSFEQLTLAGGYDHNFCINGEIGELRHAATVYEPASGRELSVYTDLPGMQFYSGNFLSGLSGKGGKPMNRRCGFCLETQYYPDTPNNPLFPQCTFDAGEEYVSRTVYKLSVR